MIGAYGSEEQEEIVRGSEEKIKARLTMGIVERVKEALGDVYLTPVQVEQLTAMIRFRYKRRCHKRLSFPDGSGWDCQLEQEHGGYHEASAALPDGTTYCVRWVAPQVDQVGAVFEQVANGGLSPLDRVVEKCRHDADPEDVMYKFGEWIRKGHS